MKIWEWTRWPWTSDVRASCKRPHQWSKWARIERVEIDRQGRLCLTCGLMEETSLSNNMFIVQPECCDDVVQGLLVHAGPSPSSSIS